MHTKPQKLDVPGVKEPILLDVDLSPGFGTQGDVVLVDVIRNFPYLPSGSTRPVRTDIMVFADAKGQLGIRIQWEDKTGAANARAVRTSSAPVPTPAPSRSPARPAPTAPPSIFGPR
jgi:hypothetical protein